MPVTFGQENPALTKAIRRVVHEGTSNVVVLPHAFKAMDDDDFDLVDVFSCLRRGTAHGPELHGVEQRCNVVHRGLHIRVTLSNLITADGTLATLSKVSVLTVMRIK